jgi:hydrogenase maturation factor
MKTLEEKVKYLFEYDGRPLRLMEVCGSHTAGLFAAGIRGFLSSKISLISGPGCPVCVTPPGFIDRCVEIAMTPGHVLVSFGDMLKVFGAGSGLGLGSGSVSLASSISKGANVQMVYSPFEVLGLAEAHPDVHYVIAAVGFETTAPAYALLLDEVSGRGLRNVKLLTSLRLALPAIEWICEYFPEIDGFLAPGHVSVITGSGVFEPLALKYEKPFVIAGFEEEHLVSAIYELALLASEGGRDSRLRGNDRQGQGLGSWDSAQDDTTSQRDTTSSYDAGAKEDNVSQIVSFCAERSGVTESMTEDNCSYVVNCYSEAVSFSGNLKAREVVDKYFFADDTVWRALGVLPKSGLFLREEFAEYDAGSREVDENEDASIPVGCRCGEVITGQISPDECPMFGNACTIEHALGPCMVSAEGACGIWYRNS